jgi:crotonobetainyl-CoA:carnitine CoA-transferase CaiB-like acyl-CoA transferase
VNGDQVAQMQPIGAPALRRTKERPVPPNSAATKQRSRGCPVKHLGIAQDVPNDENRRIRLVGQPVTLSRTPSKLAARPPEFGEQTDEVLAEFGFGADEIVALKQGKVV